MNRFHRRLLAALLTVALAGAKAPAQQTSVPRVTLTPSLGGAIGVPGVQPGSISGPAALSLSPMLSLTPALSVIPAPSIALPQPAVAAFPAAAVAPAAGAPAIGSSVENLTPAQRVAPALEALEHSAPSRRGRDRGQDRGGRMFDGSRERAAIPVAAPSREAAGPKGFIKNADGVWVDGRLAEQSRWINGMHAELSPILDLDDVMNVMDDAYDEGRVKLRSAEDAAEAHKLDDSSVHLEGTRNFVDAILTDDDGNIAVHTYSVYFHPGNRASEIREGIRRADKYLKTFVHEFAAGGLAETTMDRKFKKVELTFNTRGYKEIEDHLREQEKKVLAAYGDRYTIHYVTEPRMGSSALRAEFNRLVEKYKDQPDGLRNIINGVVYSRGVGLGHELNSHKKRLEMGLKITQAGKDFFGNTVLDDGTVIVEYKTEFDAVTEPVADALKFAEERDVVLWEDKSARIWMPLEKVMEETFLYKLRIYRENRGIIEKELRGRSLKVMFSVDVGGANRRAAKQGVLVWQDPRQKELMDYLIDQAPALSKEFGFPVGFIFVNSHPGEDSDLFYQKPVSEADWAASQGGQKHGGRKHGRMGRR